MPSSYVRPLFAAAFLTLALAVAGCGSNSTPSPNPTPAVLEKIQTPVTAGTGGTLTLLSGNGSVTIAPNILAANQTVTVTHHAAEQPKRPNKSWAIVPGTLDVEMPDATINLQQTKSLGAMPTTPGLDMTMVFPKARATAILKAKAPVVEITYKNGKTGKFSPDGTFDTGNDTVTVHVPKELLDQAVGLKLYLATDDPAYVLPSPGPRFYNGSANPAAWESSGYTIDPNAKTVVLVHGIFSSVESAFPAGKCASGVQSQGGYQQVLGFDYNWTQPPYTEAPLLAAFINSLPVSSVDLEAHSYGTVVTTAALPLITKKLNHVVLLGGPLPLNGSPQSDPGTLRDFAIWGGELAEWLYGSPSYINDAVKSGMVGSLATNSGAMNQIALGLKQLQSNPSFVQAGGTKPIPQEYYIYPLYFALYGFTTNDGIVELKSALSNVIPNSPAQQKFPLDHLQLECNSAVQSFVGNKVNP